MKAVPIDNGPATCGYLVLQVCYNVTAPSYTKLQGQWRDPGLIAGIDLQRPT
jgi:hypothetical protein